MSRIVDDMFTLTRADAGNHPMRTTPMYLNEVVDDAVRAARVVAATRDVAITVDCAPSASHERAIRTNGRMRLGRNSGSFDGRDRDERNDGCVIACPPIIWVR